MIETTEQPRPMTPPFRHCSPEELFTMTLDGIVGHVHGARAAGEVAQAALGLQMLVYKRDPLIARRVREKVPSQYVDEVRGRIYVEAMKSVVSTPPEAQNADHFDGWLVKVIANQIASWWRGPGAKYRDHESHLRIGQDADTGEIDASYEDRSYEVTEQLAFIESRCADLEEANPLHALVVKLRLFEDLSSKETAERVRERTGEIVSPTNVDQIAKRFRDDCKNNWSS